MKASSLIEVLCAAHYTHMVESEWKERGGLVLVAPPQHMKTTLLLTLKEYPCVHVASDLNSQRLGTLQDSIVGGKVHTVVIPDLQKLYERHSSVSSNLEGNIQALVEEGFISTAHQDTGGISFHARAFLATGCTPSFYNSQYVRWESKGFARRFLWCAYKLDRPQQLMLALERWRRLEIKNGLRFSLPLNEIPYSLKVNEAERLHSLIRKKQDNSTPFLLLQKIACVLRWRFRRLGLADRTMRIMAEFGEMFADGGAELEL